MENKKKVKITLIVLLILVEVFTLHLMYKSVELKDKDLQTENVKSEYNVNKRQFAIMLETSAGSKQYENKDEEYPNKFPTEGYVFNASKSGCIDINGKEVTNVLNYDYSNYAITLNTSSTVYCYLYYDVFQKAYMKALANGYNNYVIGSNNQKRVEKVEFVDYIPENLESSEIVSYYDLSDTTKGTSAGSVIGWLVLNGNKGLSYGSYGDEVDLYDLYIGSTSKIYGTNMYYAFQGMGNLKTITFNNLDTSEVTSMGWMFYECGNLTALDLSNFDTSNVTNMSWMFVGCSNLTALDLSNFDTTNVTNMSSMFGSLSLTTLDLSNFDTTNVTNMSSMFAECNSLTTLNLSSFDTTNVTNMNGLFNNCTNLTNLNLSNFKTSKVTNMSWMFQGCNNLTTLDLSNFDTSKVTNMSWMFQGCNNLTTLDLSNFNTSNVINMQNMFTSCSNLTTLNLSNFNTSKVTNIYQMFHNCSKLRTIDMRNADFGSVNNAIDSFNNVPTTAIMHVKTGQESFVTAAGFTGTIESH